MDKSKEWETGLTKKVLDHITNCVDGYLESIVDRFDREYSCKHYVRFRFKGDFGRYRSLDTERKIDNAIKESPKGFAVVYFKAETYTSEPASSSITFYLMKTDSQKGALA